MTTFYLNPELLGRLDEVPELHPGDGQLPGVHVRDEALHRLRIQLGEEIHRVPEELVRKSRDHKSKRKRKMLNMVKINDVFLLPVG